MEGTVDDNAGHSGSIIWTHKVCVIVLVNRLILITPSVIFPATAYLSLRWASNSRQ